MVGVTFWQSAVADVPRELFVPDTVWVDNGMDGYVALSRQADPVSWHAIVAADEPIVTQTDFGDAPPGQRGRVPSSSCSKPSIVASMLDALDPLPGHKVLEIGTGTGWNAALLSRQIGREGQVVTVELDTAIASHARAALAGAGYGHVVVVTGDGTDGCPQLAPFDRVIATASIRETVPAAWLDQLRADGRLVAPWSTDWSNGYLLVLRSADGAYSGGFSETLAFMRLRHQRRSLYGWEPGADEIALADISTTDCRGADLDRMLNPDKGAFAIGARLASCCLTVDWDRRGERHHILELDDGATKSWAQVDANLNDPAPFTVRQLGPRRLWDEAVAAYDWWHAEKEPGRDRFGLQVVGGRQWLWLDEPGNLIRTLTDDPAPKS